MIKAIGLAAKQGDKTIFEQLDLKLSDGEIISLLGPNGCGKTTLLRTLLGLHPKVSGEIFWQSQNLNTLNAKQKAKLISYVPQYHRLAFGYPVLEIVLMGVLAGNSDWARASHAQKLQAKQALEQLNIAHLAERPYTHLSGGQRQLVLIARALAQDTPVIFMDEPTNGLDYGNQIKLLQTIQSLQQRGRCILFTTHHPEHARYAANRTLTMFEGKLVKDGAPHQVLKNDHLCQLYDFSPQQLTQFISSSSLT